MFFKYISTVTALFFCLLLSPVRGQYTLNIKVSTDARGILANAWDDNYKLEIYKGFSKDGVDVGKLDFNTVWYSIPKTELQCVSGTKEVGFSNPIKVQFQSRVTGGDIVTKTLTAFSDELDIGQSTQFGQTGDWTPPASFVPSNQLEVQNNCNHIFKAVLFSKTPDPEHPEGKWSPFYVSPEVHPGLEIIGSPVVKLGLAFGTKLEGTFIGQIQSKDVFVVDFTSEPSQTVCIKLAKEHTQRLEIDSGDC